MDIISSFATIAFVALVHASFQLSISVLTLLGSHTIGARMSRKKVGRLISSYVLGAGVMTLLLISFASLAFLYAFGQSAPLMAWAIVCGLVLGIGIAVWIFYYRKGAGTSLWISRGFAQHLTSRSKQTKNSVEAFSLGLTSVVAEIIFIAPTVALAALVLVGMPTHLQIAGLAIYTILSLAGLVIVWAFLGSGRTLSRVQKWREANKRFLQFCAGSALIVIGTFVYVTKVVAESSGVM
jgi:hypothetical protein